MVFLFSVLQGFSQTLLPAGQHQDETVLYAMNKQVNQFVRRFNMEEDKFGKPLKPTDADYHNNKLRKKILPLITLQKV